MIESEKSIEEIIKKVNCESGSEILKTLVNNSSGLCTLLAQLPHSDNLKLLSEEIKNNAHKKLNDHDMLQANQANLKCSSSYANNIKQVININSSIHERYHKLQKISLHHILTKG